MKTAKQNAMKIIKDLPDEATYEDIMEKLFFIQKIEAGLKDIEEGRIHTHEEVKKKLAQWLN